MKTEFEDAARDVKQSVEKEVNDARGDFEKEWRGATSRLDDPAGASSPSIAPPTPVYRHPKKNWRLKRGSMPQWYRQRHGVRAKAQSGAARVARFRPPRSL